MVNKNVTKRDDASSVCSFAFFLENKAELRILGRLIKLKKTNV